MRTIETMASEHGMDQSALVVAAGISASSAKRWKRRIGLGMEPVQKPGAKKVAHMDLEQLKHKIGDLDHGNKRTAGTGRLYQANSHRISRRQFNEMVKQVRRSIHRKSAATMCTVRWLRPDLAWAIDGLQYNTCYVQNLQDLCSRYKFAPMTTAYMPCGEEIAGHLDRHLTRFGPPLFIKRDNGGNLNHRAVNDLLEEQMVIPINSPCYTAGYNGAIEHSQGELKRWLRKWKDGASTIRQLALKVENAAHALNHSPRRCLVGKNACRCYFTSSRLRFNKRKRKEVYDWIIELAVDLSAHCGKNEIDPAAWRIAARKWMENHRLIVITKPANVLPHFPKKKGHN
jgi:hypothetical protein